MFKVLYYLLLLLLLFSRCRSCRCRGCSTSQNHSQYATISLKNARQKRRPQVPKERLKGLPLRTCNQKKNILISSSWRVNRLYRDKSVSFYSFYAFLHCFRQRIAALFLWDEPL